MSRKAKPANPAYPGRVKRAARLAAQAVKTKREKGRAHRAAVNADRDRPVAVRVTPQALARMSNDQLTSLGLARMGNYVVKARPFVAPWLPPGVVPRGTKPRALVGESSHIALDSALVAPTYSWANQFCSQVGFPGYPFLAELALRSEYRSASETTAKEVTRKWITLQSQAAGDKDDKIAAMMEALEKFKVKALFRKAIEMDGYFGRYQIYMDINGQDSDKARALPLKIDEAQLGKDCLNGLSGVEPMWTTPYSYNSTDPTAPDFFKPTSWFIMGRKTHATRLLTFISRPVPDMFKPAYNFSGISMSQLMEPYVMQWLRTRDSVSDIISNYSTSGISTNLATTLEEDDSAGSLARRAQLFNETRANRGLMVLDKDTEEFFQFNTPLSGLEKLCAQSHEQMAAPTHTPLVKLLGTTPTGLNASSEGEIVVYNDYIHTEQECVADDPLDVLLDVIQLHLFGAIDPDIIHVWAPLQEPTPVELSTIRKNDADADVALVGGGVILPEESRARLSKDPQSGYSGLSGPAPEMNPDMALQDHAQQHGAAEADKDRKHGSKESTRERQHGAKQNDKDRSVAKAGLRAKTAKKKD